MISDHCTSHKLPAEVTRELTAANTVAVFVPAGCTLFVQWLDTSFFAAFKANYRKHFNEFQLTMESQKVSASRKRVLMTKWVADSLEETIKQMDILSGFKRLGYVYESDETYDPQIRDFDYHFNPDIAAPAPVAMPKPCAKPKPKGMRQSSLTDFFSQ